MTALVRLVAGTLTGALIGCVFGFFGRRCKAGCPLLNRPLAGALYGAVWGLIFSLVYLLRKRFMYF